MFIDNPLIMQKELAITKGPFSYTHGIYESLILSVLERAKY